MALCSEHEFALFLAVSTVLAGWALTERGDWSQGMARMRQGLTGYRATGAEVSRPYFLGLLAEAHGTAGQAREGLAVLAESLALVSNTEERWYEAELYRLKGDLLLAQAGDGPRAGGESETVSEAETCFRQAIAIARRQEAKSLELRAVLSLSRLLQSQGKKEEARTLLAEIYGSFAEGLDATDLKEARALLGALGG